MKICLLYTSQVMLIAQKLAGYSLTEAEDVYKRQIHYTPQFLKSIYSTILIYIDCTLYSLLQIVQCFTVNYSMSTFHTRAARCNTRCRGFNYLPLRLSYTISNSMSLNFNKSQFFIVLYLSLIHIYNILFNIIHGHK